MRREVLDFSNFSGVPNVAPLVAAGWDGVILGTQFPNVTRQQRTACQQGGLNVDALYVFVYWDSEDWRRLDEAIALCNEFGLKVWLDAEWTKTGFPGVGGAPPPPIVVNLLRQYKARLGQHYRGMYTGRWWWPSYTGNSTEFAGDDLWHAAYQSEAPNFEDFIPYGGWQRPFLWQYSSSGTLGVNADLNIEDTADVPVPGDPTLTPQPGKWGQERVGNFLVTYVDGVPVLRVGGSLPGQLAKNFGGKWWWLKMGPSGVAWWDDSPGD